MAEPDPELPGAVNTGARPRPTLRSVAAEAGVSVATVSYVLSGRVGRDAGVRAETADRVRSAASHQGYRANGLNPRLRRRRTDTVILSLTVLGDPWTQTMISAVAETLREDGLELLILVDGDWRRMLRRQGADAVFLAGVDDSPAGRAVIARLVKRGERLIVMSQSLPACGFDVIRSLDVEGTRTATQYLLDRYQTVGFLGGPPDSVYRARRLQAYSETLAAAGQPVRAEWVEACAFERDEAYRSAVRMLDRSDRPRAVFGYTDFTAIAALRAARDLGLDVPGDLAVLGASETAEGARMTPPLTSVGSSDIFAGVAQLLRSRASGGPYTPDVHEFGWVVHRPGSTA